MLLLRFVVTFLSAVFSRERNPLELVTDNGSQFVSAEFEAFLADRDIKHYRSSLYYPQANGEIKRFNRLFKDCLQTASIAGKEWKDFVRVSAYIQSNSTCCDKTVNC